MVRVTTSTCIVLLLALAESLGARRGASVGRRGNSRGKSNTHVESDGSSGNHQNSKAHDSPIVQSASAPKVQNSGQPIGWNVQQGPHGQVANPGQTYGSAYPHHEGHPQPQYNPQQPFQGYHPTSNIGVIPPHGANAGQYYNSIGGYGDRSILMNGGGYGSQYGYGNVYGGGYGVGALGGNQPHYGSNKWSNLLTGLLVWNLISGTSTRHYSVHNYYNRGMKNEEVKLEARTITDCPLNATLFCPGNTTTLCTVDHRVLCVTNATIPCTEKSTMQCVNSTVLRLPCNDGQNDHGPCNDTSFNMTNVHIPCITKASILGDLRDSNATIVKDELFRNSSSGFCVTTIATPVNLEYKVPCNATEESKGRPTSCNPANVDSKSATPWPVAATSVIDQSNTLVELDMTTKSFRNPE